MKYRKLGNTGIEVSEIGFGTIPILRGEVSILPNYYDLSLKSSLNVMEKAYELGINLFDTAVVPEYGDAEIKVGEFLKRHPDVIVSDKARAYDKKTMENAIANSLNNLKRDNCDIYFVHQVSPENQECVFSNGAVETLYRFKEKGYINCVGIATHHYDVALKAAMDERVDVIQFPGNILERGVLERVTSNAAFSQKGLLICKVFAAGVLTDFYSPTELVDFTLSYPISCAILGLGSIGQVIAAVGNRSSEKRNKLSILEVKNKLSRTYDVIPCIRCQQCLCSNNIEIMSVFRYYNYYHLGHRNWAYNKLKAINKEIYEKCISCKDKICINCCPNKIDIQEQIIKILKPFQGGRIMENKQLKPGRDYIGVGVGAVILREQKILLLLRNKSPESGCWTIPGGKVEFGETVEEAILREVQEEIGTESRIIAPLGVTNHILKEEGVHFVSPRFLVSIIGEPQNLEPESHSEMKWFSIDSLPDNVTMTTQKALSAFLTWHNEK